MSNIFDSCGNMCIFVENKNEINMEAEKMYNEKMRSINAEIVLLKGKLALHHDKFLKDITNYGYAGDLGKIESLLKEINQTFR